jgi:glycerol-3-phosphate O-acyltransferase
MTINYDKVYEGQQFPYELIGDETKRESALMMLKNILWAKEKYGRVHVKYGKPISLRDSIVEYLSSCGVDEKVFFSR